MCRQRYSIWVWTTCLAKGENKERLLVSRAVSSRQSFVRLSLSSCSLSFWRRDIVLGSAILSLECIHFLRNALLSFAAWMLTQRSRNWPCLQERSVCDYLQVFSLERALPRLESQLQQPFSVTRADLGKLCDQLGILVTEKVPVQEGRCQSVRIVKCCCLPSLLDSPDGLSTHSLLQHALFKSVSIQGNSIIM